MAKTYNENFFIRGYAIYASEEEIKTVIDKFQKCLEKNYDYVDYNCILSVAGIPYLVYTYGYECFVRTLEKAEEEYQRIDLLLDVFLRSIQISSKSILRQQMKFKQTYNFF